MAVQEFCEPFLKMAALVKFHLFGDSFPDRRVSNLLTSFMSHAMRKLDFRVGENKNADQLCSNCTADQRLCFHYMDGRLPLLHKSKISGF